MRPPSEIEIPDVSHMIPVRLRIEDVKNMSDIELLAVLNGESEPRGMMTGQTAQLIASELHARAIERASKPHWSAAPSFWLLVTSVFLSLVAIAVAVFALPQVQKLVFPSQPLYQTPTPDQREAASSLQVPVHSPATPRVPDRK